jgi:hypothetical protein
MSAYTLMEMAGVPGFGGGLALKIVSLVLHTLHAILFSVILGWAVPDIIRWESEAFLFMVSYSWYDLRRVMLSAKQRTQHFGPKAAPVENTIKQIAEQIPQQAEMMAETKTVSGDRSSGAPSREQAEEIVPGSKDVAATSQLDGCTATTQQPASVETVTEDDSSKPVHCVYHLHFARTDPTARLFMETESLTCEHVCSFERSDSKQELTSTLITVDRKGSAKVLETDADNGLAEDYGLEVSVPVTIISVPDSVEQAATSSLNVAATANMGMQSAV